MNWLQAPMLLTRLQAVGWIVASVLFALVIGTAMGYRVGTDKASAQGEAALTQLKLEYSAERELDALDYGTKLRERLLIAFKLSDDLQHERDAHEATRATLEKRISNVTKHYRLSLDAPRQPLPACVFTTGFVSVYDASIGLPERDASHHFAAGSEDASDASSAAEELDSGITQAAILQHIGQYGKYCLDTTTQLRKVLDAVEQQNAGSK